MLIHDDMDMHQNIDGPVATYTRTNFHLPNTFHDDLWNHHPAKQIDSYHGSHHALQDLHSLTNYRNFDGVDTDVHAWLVGQTPTDVGTASNNSTNNATVSSNSTLASNSSEMDFEVREGTEMSEEDIDLIEVLWKQDIDLGVDREMFQTQSDERFATQSMPENRSLKSELLKYDEKNITEQVSYEKYEVDMETGEMIPVFESNHSVAVAETKMQQNSSSPATNDDLTTLNMSDFFGTFSGDSEVNEPVDEHFSSVSINRQNSFEQRWEDLRSLLELPDVSQAAENTSILTPSPDHHLSTSDPNTLLTEEMSYIFNNNLSFSAATTNVLSPDSLRENSYSQVSLMPSLTEDIPFYSNEPDDQGVDEHLDEVFLLNGNTDLFHNEFYDTNTESSVVEKTMNFSHLLNDWSHDSAVESMGSSVSSDGCLSRGFALDPAVCSDDIDGAVGGVKVEGDEGYKADEEQFSFLLHNLTSGHSNSSNGRRQSKSKTVTVDDSNSLVFHNHTYNVQPGQQTRTEKEKEARRLKEEKTTRMLDERRAKQLKLPFSLDEVINTPVGKLTEILNKHMLSEAQLQLIRDIRRRGKNKMAAQNCRKRKMEVINDLEDEVVELQKKKNSLAAEQQKLTQALLELQKKFDSLYQEMFHVLRDDNGRPINRDDYVMQQTADGDIFLVPKEHGAERNASDSRTKKTSKKDSRKQ